MRDAKRQKNDKGEKGEKGEVMSLEQVLSQAQGRKQGAHQSFTSGSILRIMIGKLGWFL